MAKKTCKTTITIDELTDSLGLERMEDVWDLMGESDSESYTYYYDEALKEAQEDGLSEEDAETVAEEAAMEAARRELDEAMDKWFGAVESAADEFYGQHGLLITIPTKMVGKGKERQEVRLLDKIKVEPAESWREAAAEIMETINGVGSLGYYTSVTEFLKSGPYTPCEAVMSHLHWIKRHPDVYGGTSAKRMVESAMRYNNPGTSSGVRQPVSVTAPPPPNTKNLKSRLLR